MSSYEAALAAVPTQDDCWRVLLLTGEVRSMTLDELDEAFQAGLIDAHTPLLPPGETAWTRVGVAAGLDEPESIEESTLVQRHTLVLPNAPARVAASKPAPAPLPAVPATTYRTRRAPTGMAALGVVATKRGFAALAALVLLLSFGISSAARVAFGGSAAKATTSLRAAVDHVAPPAPAAPAAPEKAVDTRTVAAAAPVATPAESDGAQAPRDAQKRKDAPSRARRHTVSRPSLRGTPFLNGGDKFDPLNGAIERRH